MYHTNLVPQQSFAPQSFFQMSMLAALLSAGVLLYSLMTHKLFYNSSLEHPSSRLCFVCEKLNRKNPSVSSGSGTKEPLVKRGRGAILALLQVYSMVSPITFCKILFRILRYLLRTLLISSARCFAFSGYLT